VVRDTEHVDNLAAAQSNDAFRRGIVTGQREQVVVMTIPPGGEISEEVMGVPPLIIARGETIRADVDQCYSLLQQRHVRDSVGRRPLRDVERPSP
jgi:hypothetical protein